MIFNILDNTTELWMTKYIIGEIFSSSGATLYNNHTDQNVSQTVLYYVFVTGGQKPLCIGNRTQDDLARPSNNIQNSDDIFKSQHF